VELQRGAPQRIPMRQIKEVRVGDVAMASPPLKLLASDPKVWGFFLVFFCQYYMLSSTARYQLSQSAENLMATVIVYGQGFAMRFGRVCFLKSWGLNRNFIFNLACWLVRRHLCIATNQAVEYLAWSRGLTLQIDRYTRMSLSFEAGSHHLQALVKRHWLALVGKRPDALEVCGCETLSS
jgi:hypothetical protein